MNDNSSAANQLDPDSDLSGRQLGDYHILRRLGRGGMSVVYLAEQSSLRRQVAFKVLRRSLAERSENVARFRREARAVAALIHPHIVQVYEVGCLDGIHFIAQEYVAGQNLRQGLRRRGAFTAEAGVRVLAQVAAALLQASQRGIVHRDIKPENILLADGGDAKVADFGLARVLDGPESLHLTQAGITLGTPLYMSPEQFAGQPLDHRSDLYSLGATCYQMFADRPPFAGETLASLGYQHAHVDPRPLAELRPDLPAELCGIVHRLLAKEPDQRFASAAELLRELRSVPVTGISGTWPTGLELDRDEVLTLATRRAEVTQRLQVAMRSQRPAARGRRRLVGWLLLAVFGFLAGAGAAWTWRPRSPLSLAEGETPHVERMGSAREQFYYAALEDSEPAWLSVSLYFPANESTQNAYYARRAQQRLAELYRGEGRDEEALELYRQLADLPDSATEFRAFGLAGIARVYWERDQRALALQSLAQLPPLLPGLEAPQREELLAGLGATLRPELERMLRDGRRPGPPPPGNDPRRFSR